MAPTERRRSEEDIMLPVNLFPSSEMMQIQAAARTQPAGGQTVTFEEVRRAASQASEEREMEWFRKRLYQQLAQTTVHRSVLQGAVDISAEAMKAMKMNPSYRQQVLDMIARDLGSSYYPRQVSVYVHVGSDISDYRTQSWSAGDDAGYRQLSARSFFSTGRAVPGRGITSTQYPANFRLFRQNAGVREDAEASAASARRTATNAAYEANGYELLEQRAFEA